MALALGLGSIRWTSTNGWSYAALALAVATVVSYGYERGRRRRLQPVVAELAKEAASLPLLGPDSATATRRREMLVDWACTGLLCFWMVCCSVSIIYTNAWILDNMCPHAATLTAAQQGFGAAAAYVCVYVLELTPPVEGMSLHIYAKYMVPLAAAFTVYLWGSNSAYVYLAPGFIQMVKPLGSAIVFVVATCLGLEHYTHAKFLNFLLICGGIFLTSVSEFDGTSAVGSSRHLAIGLAVLVGAYVLVAFYNTGLQIIQRKGVVAVKLNPLTSLLYVAPSACVFLGVYAAGSEWSRPNFHCFDKLPLWVLALDCIVAFIFNLSMMLFIGKLSAVAYSLFAFLKEIILVAVAFCFFQESISRGQLEGYAVTTLAVLVWQHRKLAG